MLEIRDPSGLGWLARVKSKGVQSRLRSVTKTADEAVSSAALQLGWPNAHTVDGRNGVEVSLILREEEET
jgi:hypothetical protein